MASKKMLKGSPSAAVRPMDAVSAMFAAYWRGEMALWGAFWVWGMGVGTLIGLIFTPLSMPVLQQAYLNFYTGDVLLAGLAFYAVAVMFGFWWSYSLWHVVSIWRCSAHSGPAAKWGSRLFVLSVTCTYWPIYLLNVYVRFL